MLSHRPPSSADASTAGELDLARVAAHGDEGALTRLAERHGPACWRLARAVGADGDRAVAAVVDGFDETLRTVRRRRAGTSATVLPHLLGAVYRAAMTDRAAVPATGAPATSDPASDGLRALPGRWAAAVWLADAEGIGTADLAIILGLGESEAEHLLERGRQGLDRTRPRDQGQDGAAGAGRDDGLRDLVGPTPVDLTGAIVAGTLDSVADRPLSPWLPAGVVEDRAVRSLAVACGGLLAVALVGVGVLTAGLGVGGGSVGAQSAPAPTGSVTVDGYGAPGSRLLADFRSGLLADVRALADVTPTATAGGVAGAGQVSATTPGSVGPTGTSAAPTPGTATAPLPTGGTAPPPGKVTPPGTVVLPPTPGVSVPDLSVPGLSVPGVTIPRVSVPGVGSVGTGPGGLGVTVGGGAGSPPAAGVTLGTCTGVNLLGVRIGCPAHTPPPAHGRSSSPPTTSLLGGLLGGR